MRPWILCLALLTFTSAAGAAERTIHYPVKGKTEAEINAYIKSKGVKLPGGIPYAFTIPAVKISKSFTKTKNECRYKSYRTNLHFTYVLPKLTSTKGVPKSVLANWQALTKSLAAHERQHGDNWTQCFKGIDAELKLLSARDCDALSKKAANLENKRKLDCLKRDRYLDDVYSRELWKLPFVRKAHGIN